MKTETKIPYAHFRVVHRVEGNVELDTAFKKVSYTEAVWNILKQKSLRQKDPQKQKTRCFVEIVGAENIPGIQARIISMKERASEFVDMLVEKQRIIPCFSKKHEKRMREFLEDAFFVSCTFEKDLGCEIQLT